MNQVRTRMQGLSLLDRAMTAMTDTELEALVASLPEDHVTALDKLCGAADGFSDASARTVGIRTNVARGKFTGAMERITTVLCDPALAKCIEVLGDHADNPTEQQLLDAAPGLIDEFGLATVRLMMAGSVAGEAAASVALTRLLKHDETLALPAAEAPETVVREAPAADDATKARRREAKDAKRRDAEQRRLQQARARNRA
jgi:hypothetical protein